MATPTKWPKRFSEEDIIAFANTTGLTLQHWQKQFLQTLPAAYPERTFKITGQRQKSRRRDPEYHVGGLRADVIITDEV